MGYKKPWTGKKLLKPVKKTPDQLKEVLITALERCWDGKTPFREIEAALVLLKERQAPLR